MHLNTSARPLARRRYPALYFEMLVVGSLLILGYDMLRPFLSILAAELDPLGILVGLTISSYFLTRIFVDLPIGYVTSKVGWRRPTLLGLCLATIGTLICALSSSIYSLIIGLALWGLGTAFVFTISMSIIIDFFPSHIRGSAMGLSQGIALISAFVAAPLGGFIADYLGYASVFYVTGVITIIGLLVIFMSRELKQNIPSTRTITHVSFKETLDGLKNRGLLGTCMIELVRLIILQGIISTILPIYLYDFLKMSIPAIGIVIGVRSLGMVLTTFSGGLGSDKVGRKPIIIMGAVTQSLCIFLYTQASSFDLILILALVEGLGAGFIHVTLPALMSEQITPEYVGGALGLYRTFSDIGAVIGPILIMVIWSTFNVHAGFYFGAVLSLVSLLALLASREKSHASAQVIPIVNRAS